MQQSKQVVQNYQEDEIDLRALAFSLIERKFLILGLTAFITVLAYFYALTLSPTYSAVTSFTFASNSSINDINKLAYVNESEGEIFTDFLNVVSSQDLQKEVFAENGFLNKFNKDNKPIDNVNEFIANAVGSITIVTPKLKPIDMELSLYDMPYSISMTGNVKAVSNYLDILVKRADSKNILDIAQLNQKKISHRLDAISLESALLLKKTKNERVNQIARIQEEDAEKIRNLKDKINRARYRAKETRLSQIAVLYDSLRIAKSLGIIENNFKLFDGSTSSSDLTIAIGENLDLPEWYVYGEKALTQTIDLLESRPSDDPFIPELVTLNNALNEIQNNNLLKTLEARQDDTPFIPELIALNLEKDLLQSTEVNLSGSNSISLIHSAERTTNNPNKKMIVLLAFFGSFMMSIFLASIMYALKQDEKTPT